MPSSTAAATTTPTTSSLTTLGTKLGIDLAAAGLASFFVAPFITTVDRAVIENAAGARPLKKALIEISKDCIRNPLQFIRRKEFLLIYGVYTATYLSANGVDTLCETAEVDSNMPKFLSTTAVNMGACIIKDREFTRMFGVIAPTKFPLMSMGLFAIRDSLTVGASFIAPPILSAKFQELGQTPRTSNTLAQLTCPMLVQFLSTPLHLLSLDLYNNKGVAMGDRMSFISREYLKSTTARVARVVPAFGFGGIGNKYFRDTMRAKLL
ncbi:hypothetical protein SPRG_13165 [Saprolegnia parasitica CBS 223.65]|uniref:Uncharacterized protein n=1 Tax=Saprolegnia parasitica (strain CBS 223.65) TaxID=695850 RepID=A0A067BTC9_SAPPC|nr:hypothetical protein SPRG_13165 [Saprolegnia parasitica CBS 223.65]KDO21749.1 hypothetical protein SPRG_13165 [Saprolegnia parasitica CBS 223.65]|eukprot:XP_012207551.1 hypothetical protein SPRG_13165 [Saprolegnia parasitica CBS 223.65]